MLRKMQLLLADTLLGTKRMKPIQHLIAEATALGGGNLCVLGHRWEAQGGRYCPLGQDANCSQTVYVCSICGEYDYGEVGGPGEADCIQLGCNITHKTKNEHCTHN